jgi:hypothetical protein
VSCALSLECTGRRARISNFDALLSFIRERGLGKKLMEAKFEVFIVNTYENNALGVS